MSVLIVLTATFNQDEDAIDFANRVKREIALKGGLVDLVWDGNLKRQAVGRSASSSSLASSLSSSASLASSKNNIGMVFFS